MASRAAATSVAFSTAYSASESAMLPSGTSDAGTRERTARKASSSGMSETARATAVVSQRSAWCIASTVSVNMGASSSRSSAVKPGFWPWARASRYTSATARWKAAKRTSSGCPLRTRSSGQ